MSKVTELATGQITSTETITVELVEANETTAVIIVRWPSKPTVIHPHRFPTAADIAARTFAAAVVKLAQIKRKRRVRPQQPRLARGSTLTRPGGQLHQSATR
jgi:hypothetical protein